jgi:hypothetical protein
MAYCNRRKEENSIAFGKTTMRKAEPDQQAVNR